MQTGIFENMPQFGKYVDMENFETLGNTAISATKELVSINSRVLGKMFDNQVDLANIYIEGSEKQMKAVGSAGDIKEFTALQTKLFNEYASKFTKATENNFKLARQAGEELQDWFKKNLESAQKVTKQVVGEQKAAARPKAKTAKAA